MDGPTDLKDFVEWCANAALDARRDHPDTQTLVIADDPILGGLLCGGIDKDESPERAEELNIRLFKDSHCRFAGWATLTNWSPDDVTPFGDAWALTCVELGQPALFVMLHVAEERLYLLHPNDTPWFMLSTAGSLRKALQGNFDSPVRKVGDKRLFSTPADGTPPPVHDDGRI